MSKSKGPLTSAETMRQGLGGIAIAAALFVIAAGGAAVGSHAARGVAAVALFGAVIIGVVSLGMVAYELFAGDKPSD